MYFRYVDDVLLDFVKICLRNLTFTLEEPSLDGFPFLDLSMKNINSKSVSTWYRKSLDTGVILNFNAVIPHICLSEIVSGFVHRIFNACSNWEEFNESWAEAEKILTKNQYPKQFISKILNSTLTIYLLRTIERPEQHPQKDQSYIQSLAIIRIPGKIFTRFCFQTEENTASREYSPHYEQIEKCSLTLQKRRSLCPEVSCSE